MSVSVQQTILLQFWSLAAQDIKFRKAPTSYMAPVKTSRVCSSFLTKGCRMVAKLKAASGDCSDSESDREKNDHHFMDEESRYEMRKKIKQVLAMNPDHDVEQDIDPVEKQKKMQKLISDYSLLVEEEDPNWPADDGQGWGFSLGQFFNKITIKNVRDDDNDDYDSDDEIVWQDDNYIRPIKEITTVEWEQTVFKDISPLMVLVHNRYRRPKENEKLREEIVKAVKLIWECRLPTPRCVAVDAIAECDLVDALGVTVFPELIYTKAGKILYRDKAIRDADELSKIMAFFYYGAAKPPCLNNVRESHEIIPKIV